MQDINIKECRKILVIGDAGRGKTTMSRKLSKKLGIKHIQMDNIIWKKKYTHKRDHNKQVELLKKNIK